MSWLQSIYLGDERKYNKKLTRELNEEKVHEKCLRQCVEIDFLEQQ